MYTTKSKVEKYLNVDISDSFNTQVNEWITSVKKWIDKYCGKTFESSSSVKYYDGCGSRILDIDDCSSVPTEILILNADGTTGSILTEGASNDYLVYPRNEGVKNQIRLVAGSRIGNFPMRDSSVKITAPFGFSEIVPDDVSLIATKLVGEIIKEGLKGGKLASITLGDYSADFQKIDETADPLGIYQTLDLYRDIVL